METVGKNIINVQEIEPRFRHQTIFDVFENLKDGESLIIHNNHDPMPVFYQMQDFYGPTFTWDYLQRGPEWWDVQVTKVEVLQQNAEKIYEGEKVIDVPSIANHQLKHQTIFDVFNNLAPNESFIIHNDHDPKPVFYQLQAMHGDVFQWEYLEQGPKWWDIRVTLKGEDQEETLGEIVTKNFHTAEVFKKYGLDFCCHGNRSIRQACQEKGIDATLVENDLKKVTQQSGGNAANLNFDEWNLDFLADYIVNTHHKYIRKNMPEITQFAAKVAHVHGGNHPELHTIKELVDQIAEEFYEHLDVEEKELFPMIKEIVQTQENNAKYAPQENRTFKTAVREAEEDHENVGYALEEIRKLSRDYTLPNDACASYTLLFKMLEDLENDTFTHIHLENNLLFPKAEKIEENFS